MKQAIALGDGWWPRFAGRQQLGAPGPYGTRTDLRQVGVAEARQDVPSQVDLVLLPAAWPEVRLLGEPLLGIGSKRDVTLLRR